MFKRIVRLLIVSVVCYAIIIITTFGFRLSKSFNLRQVTKGQLEISYNLQSHVRVLSEEVGIRNFAYDDQLQLTADYIIKKFEEMGYDVEVQTYTIGKEKYQNISAIQPVNNDIKEIIIIGAHYDSCFNPGADDNASGISGLLELARLLKNEKSKYAFRFVAFTNEEPPFFYTEAMGSRVYAKWVKQQNLPVKAVVVLEMIGYYSDKLNSQRYLPLLGLFFPNKGNFIALVSNFGSGSIVNKIYNQFKNVSVFPIEKFIAPGQLPGIYFSDHSSFWKEGIPAIMVTDTAYLRNKNYHKQSDKLETLSFEHMAVVVQGLAQSLINLEL